MEQSGSSSGKGLWSDIFCGHEMIRMQVAKQRMVEKLAVRRLQLICGQNMKQRRAMVMMMGKVVSIIRITKEDPCSLDE